MTDNVIHDLELLLIIQEPVQGWKKGAEKENAAEKQKVRNNSGWKS